MRTESQFLHTSRLGRIKELSVGLSSCALFFISFPHCTFWHGNARPFILRCTSASNGEILAVNWDHSYSIVGRMKGSMVLKFETERKVNCPHRYLFSIIQQTIPTSQSLSLSMAHTAMVSCKMAFHWDFGNFESAERETLKKLRFCLVCILNSVAVFLLMWESQSLRRLTPDICKNSCISTLCFKAND